MHGYQPRYSKRIKVADIPSPIHHDIDKVAAMTTEEVGMLEQLKPLGNIMLLECGSYSTARAWFDSIK